MCNMRPRQRRAFWCVVGLTAAAVLGLPLLVGWSSAGAGDDKDRAKNIALSRNRLQQIMLTLHEYNGVGHGFNLATAARKDQAAGQDALERTIANLKQALPAEGAK